MTISPAFSTWGLVAVAVACNAVAQLLIKQAHVVDAFSWRAWAQPTLAAAVLLYGLAFVLTALVFARLPLTVISPLMAGAIFVGISILSVLFLGESLTWARLAGMALVLAGIAVLARAG